MWLPRILKNALESLEAAQNIRADLEDLRAAVKALEALQLDREIQWTETKDQVLRHLKRAQAIKQHGSGNDLVAAVLAKKFPNHSGG